MRLCLNSISKSFFFRLLFLLIIIKYLAYKFIIVNLFSCCRSMGSFLDFFEFIFGSLYSMYCNLLIAFNVNNLLANIKYFNFIKNLCFRLLFIVKFNRFYGNIYYFNYFIDKFNCFGNNINCFTSNSC